MHDYPPRRSCFGQSQRGLCAAIVCAAAFAWAPACLAQKEVAPFAPSHQIAARIHWIQFHMISGRIVASSPMVVPRTTVPPSTSHVGGRKEHLSIEISAAVASLQYDLVTADEHLQITVEDGNQVSLRHSRSKEPQFEFEFQQRPDEPLRITLDDGDVKQSWQADGFWQLS
ncbi:MAG TPA: hypothetical protein VHV08_02190, partial [Pirellulales bacterium]|nr:hypothetical protein [Pirellulales bacterium]